MHALNTDWNENLFKIEPFNSTNGYNVQCIWAHDQLIQSIFVFWLVYLACHDWWNHPTRIVWPFNGTWNNDICYYFAFLQRWCLSTLGSNWQSTVYWALCTVRLTCVYNKIFSFICEVDRFESNPNNVQNEKGRNGIKDDVDANVNSVQRTNSSWHHPHMKKNLYFFSFLMSFYPSAHFLHSIIGFEM